MRISTRVRWIQRKTNKRLLTNGTKFSSSHLASLRAIYQSGLVGNHCQATHKPAIQRCSDSVESYCAGCWTDSQICRALLRKIDAIYVSELAKAMRFSQPLLAQFYLRPKTSTKISSHCSLGLAGLWHFLYSTKLAKCDLESIEAASN